MSLLEQDTTKKGRVDDKNVELDTGDKNGDYEVEVIQDSKVYAKELELGHLLGLYYLVSWKGYLEEENTWEPASAVQHLKKLISSFHKDHLDKPTVTSLAIDTAPPMVRLTVKPAEPLKWKRGRLANSTNKRAKKWAAFDFYHVFGWIRVTSKSDVLSRVARDCTWLSADRFSQNFYFSTSSSLSHKASVFLLQLSLGQEVFHQRPSTVTGFPPQSPVIGLGGFSPTTWSSETHQLPHGARMFSFITWFSSSV